MIIGWLIFSILSTTMIMRHPIWKTNRFGAFLIVLGGPIGFLALFLDNIADRRELNKRLKEKQDITVFNKKRNNGFDDFLNDLDKD